MKGAKRRWTGQGADAVEAAVAMARAALGIELTLLDHQRHAIARSGAGTAAYVELKAAGGAPVLGAGIDSSADGASVMAILSAMNRFATAPRAPVGLAV